MPARRRHIVLLVLLVGLATAGRLAYAYWVHAPGKSVYSDMKSYMNAARHLREGTLGPWDTFFPIGYPAMIAGAYTVSNQPLRLMAVAQALAGGLTCLLAYVLARRITLSPAWSLVATSLIALYPPFVFYGSLLLTESVSPLLFTLMIWLMLRAIDTPRWPWAAMLGVTFAVASLVRTNFLPFAPVMAVCLWVGARGRWKTAITQLAVVAVAALPLLTWSCAVNSSLTGRWSGPSTNGGLNFCMMQAEVAKVQYYEAIIEPRRNLLKYKGSIQAAAPFYEERYYYREGMRLIRADPWRAVARASDGIRESLGLGLQTFWPAPPILYPGLSPSLVKAVMRSALAVTARAFVFVLMLPPLVVIVMLATRGTLFDAANVIWLAVAGVFATMVFTSVLFLADPRMHVPYDALLIVTSVIAIQRAWQAAQERRRRALQAAVR
jgi:4-amino-4-deoxy-L-arabinose transferase-like glycosyltransferase